MYYCGLDPAYVSIVSLIFCPGLNATILLGKIGISSRVFGFLPGLPFLSRNSKLPKPDSLTSLPSTNISLIAQDVLDMGVSDTLKLNLDSLDISYSIDGDTNLSDGITGWTQGADSGNYSVYTDDSTTAILHISVDDAVIG